MMLFVLVRHDLVLFRAEGLQASGAADVLRHLEKHAATHKGCCWGGTLWWRGEGVFRVVPEYLVAEQHHVIISPKHCVVHVVQMFQVGFA